MKTFSIHVVRNVLAVVIALGIGYIAYTVNPSVVSPTKVEAGASKNVTGWAWGEGSGADTDLLTGSADPAGGPYTANSNPGIGWLSLNSFDCDVDKNGFTDSGACGGNNTSTVAQDYGINISPLSGVGSFSGQVWSPNEPDISGNPTGQGWISFDRSITGNPTPAWGDPGLAQSGSPLAYVDWSTGNVYGWARAIVACKDNRWDGTKCTSPLAGDKAGGWDGWIKLSDASWANGVKIANGKFSGLAWGGEVVGWLDFAPSVSGVPVNSSAQITMGPCTPSNPTIVWGTCDATASCVSGGATTQYNLSGTQYGLCPDGSTGSPVQTCTAPSTDCSAANSSSVYIVGDGICNTAAGENSTNSLQDCKPKTNFFQF